MWMDVRECADVRCLAMMNGEADVAGSHQISFRRGLHSQSLGGGVGQAGLLKRFRILSKHFEITNNLTTIFS